MFHDRRAAGELLARRLLPMAKSQPVVLALPRGGVPVAAAVAETLKAPLGLLHVRKIGAPTQPELAVAAIADGETPRLAINHRVAEELGISEAYLKEAGARELKEIERRKLRYEGGHPGPGVKGRSVILVDDGIATGATVRAALLALRASAPAGIVLAIPVAPQSAIDQVADLVDEVVCLEIPARFMAVGEFYVNFQQVSDGEVEALMRDARQRMQSSTPARR
ncbi:MAG: phosphoribosyltransferase family protein [Ferrovibrio sp.]|uniref:phosphoribosyltransferase n=1 Tax=Ferrovibrio sp. TaxID=1917215 RepID=UPI002619B88D|nr:phosphoribosyltransferase family protein [Ferrovibrio sp.]MCW0234802.1 phosphoribosyltransferase family protein [Ferrovibrio sp.]